MLREVLVFERNAVAILKDECHIDTIRDATD